MAAVSQVYWSLDWNGCRGWDIHVLRDSTVPARAPKLDAQVIIHMDDGNYYTAANPPVGVTVTFSHYPFTDVKHGFTVDNNTGQLVFSAIQPAPIPSVPNLILIANVASAGPTISIPIRVHIHNSITAVSLSPDPMTVRSSNDASSLGPKLTVLAEFDDAAVGDISFVAGLAWASLTPADATVDATKGKITVLNPGALVDIQVTLPPAFSNLQATATIKTAAPWSTVLTVKQVATGGPGTATVDDAGTPNIVFLSDGFKDGESALFEGLLAKVMDKVARSWVHFPWNLAARKINVWSVFLASTERGATVMNGLSYDYSDAKDPNIVNMKAIPPPIDPGGTTINTLSQLLFKVGLPVRGDGAAVFGPKKIEWAGVYDAGYIDVASIPPAVFNDWTDLSTYTLAFDQDTAFGISTGSDRPRASPDEDDGRVVYWHPLRATRKDVDAMLDAVLTTDAPPVSIGHVWTGYIDPNPPHAFIPGKDRKFVFILSAGARRGGAEQADVNAALIAGALVDRTEVRVIDVAGTDIKKQIPYDIPGPPTNPLTVFLPANVAHEMGHAVHLGDEYGEGMTITDLSLLTGSPNLQSEASLLTGGHLDGSKVAWNWPRMAEAGVLQLAPVDMLNGQYTLVLAPKAATRFKVGDGVRLRQWPLTAAIAPSTLLTIVEKDQSPGADALLVVPSGALIPGSWPAKSLVYKPAIHPATGAEATMMADGIRDWISDPSNHGPLNRTAVACVIDGDVPQLPVNLPPTFPRGVPRNSYDVVGLYDGGAEYYCGVYHPAGVCLMRSFDAVGGANAVARICAICRYILLDYLDPGSHWILDRVYAREYPLG